MPRLFDDPRLLTMAKIENKYKESMKKEVSQDREELEQIVTFLLSQHENANQTLV